MINIKKTYSALAVLLIIKSLTFSTAHAYSGPARPELFDIFDGRGARIDASSFISAYGVPVSNKPTAVQPGKRQKMLYEILAEHEESGNKDILPTMQEIKLMLQRDYGNPPSADQNERIRQALVVLKDSKFGREMCAAAAYECTPESLKKAGIVILVKDLSGENETASASVPPPVKYAGQIYIGVGNKFIDGAAANPYNLGVVMSHEMSHIEDLNKNRLGTLAKALYATEEKAFIRTLAVYDELSRKSPNCYSALLDVMLDVWKWKNENGPYPRHRTITVNIDGEPKVLTTGALISNYMEPAFSFIEAMKNMVHSLYRHDYGNPSVNPELIKTLNKETFNSAAAYKNWRLAPVVPVQQPSVIPPTVAPGTVITPTVITPAVQPTTVDPSTQQPSGDNDIEEVVPPATNPFQTPTTHDPGNPHFQPGI